MPIWVDADACPVPIREILCRAATRWQIQTTFIANHAISLPPSPHISRRQVPHGFDVADNEIMDQMSKGDLVILTHGDVMETVGSSNTCKVIEVR